MRWLDTTDWEALRKVAELGKDFIFGMKPDDFIVQTEAANNEQYGE